MMIYVDADACPVVNIVEEIAKEFNVKVSLLCDTNHILNSDYSTVHIIDAGADAVDLALINMCNKGDVVVTQDYGLASLAISKGAYAIHQSGNVFTNENIDSLLMSRYLSKKARMSKSKHHLKGPKKRTEEDDKKFYQSFKKLLTSIL